MSERKRLPPFVIIKRICAGLCGFAAIAIAIGHLADNAATTEGEQMALWSVAGGFAAVGAWLWGGREPE